MSEKDDKGFVIKCKDGDIVVPGQQVNQMMTSCDYFANVFRHSTCESEDRLIDKPEWSTKTTKNIIKLLTTGETKVNDLNCFNDLSIAADQILVHVRLSPTNTRETIGLDDRKFEENLSSLCVIEYCFRTIDAKVWEDLLSNGVVLLQSSGLKVVKASVTSNHAISRTGAFSLKRRHKFSDLNTFGIGISGAVKYKMFASGLSSEALHKTCRIIRRAKGPASGKKVFEHEEFSLRVPLSFLLPNKMLVSKINEKLGTRGYVHNKSSLGYFLDGGQEPCPTFFGTFGQLHDALNLVNEAFHFEQLNKCSLRIAAPSTKTLQALIEASQFCQDNPGTIGVDIAANAYFAVKTVKDMVLMLENLKGESKDSTGSSTVPFKVVELNYPKGVF